MVPKILPNVRKYSRVFGNFVLNIIPRLALLMQIHFRLPWIGDQLHQPTTRTTYRTKIGASRYKVRVRFVWAPLILVFRRKVDHAHPPHPAVHHLHHGHGDPLRLLLRHQAAQGREGPRGRRWDTLVIHNLHPETSNWRHLVEARLYLCHSL